MSTHCEWCGQFARASAVPLPFLNVLGDPVRKGPLCPQCETVLRGLAARNVLREPHQPSLARLRADYPLSPVSREDPKT